MNEATPQLTKEQLNAKRRAYYSANIARLRAVAKAWRRKRRGLPPLPPADVLPALTFQQEFAGLQERFRRETGMRAQFTIEVTENI